MLKFSTQDIKFDYNTNSHLATKIIIKNTQLFPIAYKFKVNRPRFYLVKPDRGVIPSQGSVQINIKLHKQGISQANTDKFKCFYTRIDNDYAQNIMDKFQQKPGTQHQKFLVLINNLPEGLQSIRNINVASSQLKSLQNTKLNSINSNKNSTTIQSILKQRQDRVHILKSQIQSMQKSLRDRKIAQGPTKKSSLWVPMLVTGGIGILLGFISSAWI